MTKVSNEFVFYFVIMDKNEANQMNLRHLIHSLVPQAIIESIYDFGEANSFFKTSKLLPNILFLSEEMSLTCLNSYQNSADLNLNHLPLVFLTEQKFSGERAEAIYAKPYDAADFLSLIGSMNHKWLA